MHRHLHTTIAPLRAVAHLIRREQHTVAQVAVRPVDAVIDVDEFVEAASTPEFAQLTQRADARVRDLGFV
ncbi:MAG: hypothetical protein M3141_06955 [Actinomycetota bacterium]|nr:hypothetical protein [Actinomycetota bacterium]